MSASDTAPIHVIVPIMAKGLPIIQKALMMVNYRDNYQLLYQTPVYTWYAAENAGTFLGSLAALDLQFGDDYPMMINVKDELHVTKFDQTLAKDFPKGDATKWYFNKSAQDSRFDTNLLTGEPLNPSHYLEFKQAVVDPKSGQSTVETADLGLSPLRILTDSEHLSTFTPVANHRLLK